MKKNLIVLLLGIALIASVLGNIYLFKNRSDTREQVAVISNQLLTADNQIADLQEQLTDFTALQTQVDDLQRQLADQERLLNEQSIITPQSDVQQEIDTPSTDPENTPNDKSSKDQPKNEDPLSGFPGYEGEKDGYKFCPGVGYVPISDDPGGNKNPDRPVIEYEPCVYDENGNCTIHKHRGNV